MNVAIVDFGANYYHTHHKALIESYAKFLMEFGLKVQIYIPKNSKIDFPNIETRKNLFSIYHHQSLHIKKKSTYTEAIFGYIQRILSDTNKNNLFFKCLRYFLLLNYKHRSIKKMRVIQSENKILFFPTACPVTLKAISALSQNSADTLFLVRLTNTVENLKIFSGILPNIISKDLSSNLKNIRIGYETEEYKNYLTNLGAEISMYHTPTPPQKRCKTSENIFLNLDKGLKVAFLGTPQNHKGIENLEYIVKKASENKDKNIKWIIQSKNYDLRDSKNIRYIKGYISDDLMDSIISDVDCLCLPYQPEFYKMNASAMAYRILDLKKTLITLEGSAFANELKKFDSAIVVKTIPEFASELYNLNTHILEQFKHNIENYNRYRYTCNTAFFKGII